MSSIRRNSLANVGGRLTTAVLWIVATPFVLSHLGPERFGIWSLFFAFYGYLASFDFGIGNTMLRFIAAQRPTNDRRALVKILRRGLWAALGLGVVWALAIELSRAWIARLFHVPAPMMSEALDALRIFGIGVFLLFFTQALTASLQGFERIDLANLCTALGVVAHVIVLFVAITSGGGLRGVALAGVIGQAITGGLASMLLHRQLLKVPRGDGASGPGWREMLRFSAALQLLWMLIMLQIQSPRTVLGILGNLKLVADYELAFRVASTVGSVPILIRDPVIPVVSRLWGGEGRDSVSSLFTSTSRWVYAHAVVALGLLWTLAPDIARVWLGPGHERIADLMRMWAVAYALNLAYAPGVAIARGMGLLRFEIWSYAAALATNLGLAIAWVPRYGAAGAVAAVAISYGVGFLVFVVPFHRATPSMPFWSWFRGDLLPRAVAGLGAVALTTGVMGVGSLANRFAHPGWQHACVTGTLFLICFGLLFLPLGDTQRLVRTVWRADAAPLPRGEITSS